jgi:vacuolar-type H+-ATPase subunit E/Vma4
MTHTIEAFINQLQTDGVEAGREAAEKIRLEAEQQAQGRMAEATEQARRIVEGAQAESEQLRARTETELKLAARDTVLRLQETLNRALRAVLFDSVREKLEDADFLAGLIRDVVLRYAEADAMGHGPTAIGVSEDMRQRLLSSTAAAFLQAGPAAPQIDLRGTLAEAGFEYAMGAGTVEVTAASVVEVLSGMVGSELRKRIAAACPAESSPA